MAIDTSGTWWKGTEPADLGDYLAQYTRQEEAYPATAFRLIRCPCRSLQFRLARAWLVTRRVCVACKRTKFICRTRTDWEEGVAEAGIEPYRCATCGSVKVNVAVGFAGYDDPKVDAVRWYYVGVRCVRCGVLGCFADGKVARGPARSVYRSA